MHGRCSGQVVGVGAALLIVCCLAAPVAARNYGRGGGMSQAQMRQQRINAATQQLAMGRSMLAQAEAVVNDAQSQVSASNERIEGARRTISESRSGVIESNKSLKTIEADILAAQDENSEYAKASLAFHEAQDQLHEAQERILGSDEYLAKKKELAAATDDPEHATKLASLKHDALNGDPEFQKANDKFKSAKLVYTRVKTDLFKANNDWVAANQSSREASQEEAKASSEATRGAFKKLPAMRTLRKAQEVAAEARVTIAQAEWMLKSLNAPIPKPQSGQASYSSVTTPGK